MEVFGFQKTTDPKQIQLEYDMNNNISANDIKPVSNQVSNPRTQQNKNPNNAIDLLDLAAVLWDKRWVLLVSMVVGAVLAFAGTKFFITPQYESTSMIYIYSKTTSVTSLADLQLGSQLTVDFQIVAKTREVIESTIAELGLNATYEQMAGKITIANPSNSHVLKITVKDADPQLAADISNSIANQLRGRIADVMNTTEPSMVEKAIPAKNPVSPSVKKNTLKGAVLLFAAVAAIYCLIYIMDDTVKTEDDIEKYLQQTVLAVFSSDTSLSSQGSKTKKLSRSQHEHHSRH